MRKMSFRASYSVGSGLCKDFPCGTVAKSPSANRRHEFDPWVEKIPWRRNWQPTPALWPGEFHGSKTLASHTVREVTKSGTRLSD